VGIVYKIVVVVAYLGGKHKYVHWNIMPHLKKQQ